MSKRILTDNYRSSIDTTGKPLYLFLSFPLDNLYAVIIADDNKFEGL